MNKSAILLCIILFGIISGCEYFQSRLDPAKWPEVKAELMGDSDMEEPRKGYIVDQISQILEKHSPEKPLQYSYEDLIDRYAKSYDSMKVVILQNRENNKILDDLLMLEKAESVSLDADRGFIIMSLNFKNSFSEPIQHMILTYKYIDDYDNLYFTESSKLTDQAADDFNGRMQVIMTDIFNGENEFVYLNSDLSATEVLENNYGIENPGRSAEKEYLNEGLKIQVVAVQFKNGNRLTRRKSKWRYLD